LITTFFLYLFISKSIAFISLVPTKKKVFPYGFYHNYSLAILMKYTFFGFYSEVARLFL